MYSTVCGFACVVLVQEAAGWNVSLDANDSAFIELHSDLSPYSGSAKHFLLTRPDSPSPKNF